MFKGFRITLVFLVGAVDGAPASADYFYYQQPGFSSYFQTFGPAFAPFKGLNVYSDAGPQGFSVHILAPGYRVEDLNIQINGRMMQITASEQSAPRPGPMQFMSWGMQSRSVWLPEKVDPMRMQTQPREGGLLVLFPWRM
ncbi:MAG: Hsp20 family protein [gamma proteobacterium symbiont of Phacoides pectinatus]